MGLLSRIKKDHLTEHGSGLLKRALDIRTSVENETDDNTARGASLAVKKKPLMRY